MTYRTAILVNDDCDARPKWRLMLSREDGSFYEAGTGGLKDRPDLEKYVSVLNERAATKLFEHKSLDRLAVDDATHCGQTVTRRTKFKIETDGGYEWRVRDGRAWGSFRHDNGT